MRKRLVTFGTGKYPQIFRVISKLLHPTLSKTIGPMIVNLDFACEEIRNLSALQLSA